MVSALAVGLLAPLLVVLTLAAPPGRDGLVLLALAAGAGLPRRWAAPSVVATCLLAGLTQLARGAAPSTVLFTVVNDGVTGAAAIGGRLLIETASACALRGRRSPGSPSRRSGCASPATCTT
jgi:hypothetical protein